jgi:Na+/proline symporter/C4-dicarboxylate-specific signal transduction histidine kinase
MFSLLILALVGAYMAALFVIAWRGERAGVHGRPLGAWTYAFSLAIYCTSWTYYGAVGTASRAGWEYLPIYIGPVLGLTLLFPLWRRIAAAARREKVGSIADFISSRYGRSQTLGAVVAMVAVVGSLPYIALQLKALAMGWALITAGTPAADLESLTVLLMAAALAGFSILFGARRPDLTEHNRGLVQAIALESVVKLAALVAAALFALFLLNGSPDPTKAWREMGPLAAPPVLDARFAAITLLATLAMFCLPRQFHVAFVEGSDPAQARRARWVFPIYLLITSLAVLPLVAAGGLFGNGNPDLLVLSLPFGQGAHLLTAAVFVGGFSAATAMVIVEAVALSAMVSNNLILPFVTRSRWRLRERGADMAGVILQVRRGAIVVLLLLAWLYFQAMDHSAGLASIGLVSFAAMGQLAPALFGAVLWRRGHASGALAGIAIGCVAWLFMLALPQLTGHIGSSSDLALGVFVSLGLNTAVYVLISQLASDRLEDRIQAQAFIGAHGPDWSEMGHAGAGASVGDLKSLVARFIGQAGAERAFSAWSRESGRQPLNSEPADAAMARAAERMLAGAVGSSSARRVIAAALAGGSRAPEDVVRMLDEASQAVQFNRELLQTTLDNIDQGVAVVDHDLRLVAWNRRYVELFDLPPGFVHVGLPIRAVYRLNAERGESHDDIDAWVERRLEALRRRIPHEHERRQPDGRVLRSTGAPIPDGGYVTSYTDITELRRAAQALENANQQLEERVADRTALLDEARRTAEEATASKTRFLAAASHDLLQPLHAARLFIAALKEDSADETAALAHNADRAIENAHGLMTALLNLSRLDAGGVKPAVAPMALASLFGDLAREFSSMAAAKSLTLNVERPDLWVVSDRNLLRSMLQNLIGNAIRYTDSGGVTVAAIPSGDTVRIEVRDTGRGVPPEKREAIFAEFTRLPGAPGDEPGAGLGLAIVRRLAVLLDHPLDVDSTQGEGSTFSVTVPLGVAAEAAAPETARTPSPLAGLSVLCVDNEPAILDGLCALLARWGVEPARASDAGEALASKAQPDAALVDLHLGEGPDGLAVIEALRARGVSRIALITADTGVDLKERVQALGAHLMGKPVRPATLKAFLSRQG